MHEYRITKEERKQQNTYNRITTTNDFHYNKIAI